jgi:hypothetical protein
MVASSSCLARPCGDRLARRLLQIAALVLATIVSASIVSTAFAGQASSGELFFYPCTDCHPVQLIPGTQTPTRRLPNDFKGHGIVLEGHDKLGSQACLACHDDASRNPGMLKLADGTLIDINGDVSLVCYRCHSSKYKEFKAGTHGKHKTSCVVAGCHDPHTPGFIYASPLMPFIGSGFQFRVLSKREPFMPLAAPAPAPPITIPLWFVALVFAGLITVGGLAGNLVLGRSKR